MIALVLGCILGAGLVLWFVMWWRSRREDKRPPSRSERCASCRHDLLSHQMNIGGTNCQCCLYHRGLAQKNH